MKRMQELDGIRAIAVLAVIADHYAPFRTFGDGVTATLGTLGVDVFFVLSGYLITTILLGLRREQHAYRIFYARRFLRILPPYALLLLLVYGTTTLLNEPIDGGKLLGHLLFLQSFKTSGHIFSQLVGYITLQSAPASLFGRIVQTPISTDYPRLAFTGSLGPTWSLSVEEWFYVLWAPVVLVCRRRLVLKIGIAACATGFVFRWLTGNGASFFSAVDILVSGALLALWIEHRRDLLQQDQRRVDRFLALATLCSSCLYLLATVLHRDRMAVTLTEIAVAGGLAWIIRNSGTSHRVLTFLRWRPLGYLGTISYMTYLIHLPMYFAVRSALPPLIHSLAPTVQLWIVAIGSILATVLFASLSWRYFESPLLALKDRVTNYIASGVTAAQPSLVVEG
jgi:peptidoglycan/LPS O-acetylase OafA/YrhL